VTATTQLAPPDVETVLRTAACLGALGFSPHDVPFMVAADLDADPHVVARILRSTSGSVCAIA